LLVSLLLSLVFFGKPVEAQQIQSNGTPLEVRPALNFQTALACTNDADSTNCDVDSNLVLFYSDQDLGADYLVDTVNGAPQIDSDNDTIPEIYCIDLTNTCLFDVDEDGASDLAVTGTGINYDGGYFLAAAALGSGNGATSTAAVSACIMRDSTTSVDRLFEDKNCNSTTGTYTPEAGEGMLTDIIEKLTSTHTLASTTGTQVGGAAGFEIDLDGVATYEVIYNILSQSSSATVGLSYGVSFTGTSTLNCERRYVASAAGTIASGTVGPLAYEVWATATASTTAPNLGPNTGGVQTINTTALEIVRCLIDVTVAGDLQFWHSSETATNTSVMANSTVRAVRIN
jgi:hypothetical protein